MRCYTYLNTRGGSELSRRHQAPTKATADQDPTRDGGVLAETSSAIKVSGASTNHASLDSSFSAFPRALT